MEFCHHSTIAVHPIHVAIVLGDVFDESVEYLVIIGVFYKCGSFRRNLIVLWRIMVYVPNIPNVLGAPWEVFTKPIYLRCV